WRAQPAAREPAAGARRARYALRWDGERGDGATCASARGERWGVRRAGAASTCPCGGGRSAGAAVRHQQRGWLSRRAPRGRERVGQRGAACRIRNDQDVPCALRRPAAALREPALRLSVAHTRTDRELLQGLYVRREKR